METKRILFISEAPYSANSVGKVTLYLTESIAEMGHEVYVIVYTGNLRINIYGVKERFNPRRVFAAAGSPIADMMPDVDVTVVQWSKAYPFEEALREVGRVDAVISYYYTYIEHDLNKLVHDHFTSRGIPSVVYPMHEAANLVTNAAISVLAHSFIAAPTKFVLERFVDGILEACMLSRAGCDADELTSRTSVVYHGLDTEVYSPKTAEEIMRFYPEPRGWRRFGCRVVGMLAKNHIRKNYGMLLRVVARHVAEGRNLCAGLFWIDAIGAGYWSPQDLFDVCRRLYGVDMSERVVSLPDRWRALGVPEDALVMLYRRHFDLHLFLTRGEAFGLPPVESALVGVPTVSTAIPPQEEIFSGTEIPLIPADTAVFDNYILYEPREDHAYRAVLDWYEDPEDLRRRVERSRSILAEKVDRRRVARKMMEAVEKAQRKPEPLAAAMKIPLEVLVTK